MGSGAFLVEACRQLGEALLKAWTIIPIVPRDSARRGEPELYAQRLVAQRCLYGVDKNPMAVDLAKLSLWLATLAKDHPFTFLDHALRCGDSLVGLGPDADRRSSTGSTDAAEFTSATKIALLLLEADRAPPSRSKRPGRNRLTKTSSNVSTTPRSSWTDARLLATPSSSRVLRGGQRPKEREKRSSRGRSSGHRAGSRAAAADEPLEQAEQDCEHGPSRFTPFHWEIEFPEVFGRDEPWLRWYRRQPAVRGQEHDAAGHAAGYLDWLKAIHAESHGNADLVAHFFRRAFNLLRQGGTFGLIATNTIGQGDTRSTGLRWICTHGGTIYAARRA